MNLSSPPPGHDLDALLDALPRELPPQRELWAGIAAAIAAPAVRPARLRWPYALAAGVSALGFALLLASHTSFAPLPLAQLEQQSGTAPVEPVARALAAKESDYQATRASLQGVYAQRVAMLSPMTRARIAADLASIRRAQDDIRRALAADPGSRVLVRLYESTTQQEFDLYSIVGRNTEQVATRTRL